MPYRQMEHDSNRLRFCCIPTPCSTSGSFSRKQHCRRAGNEARAAIKEAAAAVNSRKATLSSHHSFVLSFYSVLLSK